MTQNLLLNKDEFRAFYFAKKQMGLMDKEIADLLFIGKNTLYRYKVKYDLPRNKMHNRHGLTKEMVEQAEKLGLNGHMINKRIRDYDFTLEDAISIPPIPRELRRKWKNQSVGK